MNKGTLGTGDSRNETLLPRPDGKIKPLPPVPPQTPANNECRRSLTPKGRDNRRQQKEETERERSVAVTPPRAEALADPKVDDGLGVLTLQRSKPANMKEKVEKWRERRSDILISDRIQLENRNMKTLK